MNKNSVLCAIDVNDYDQQVVDMAATFAKQFRVNLNILHVTLFPELSNAAFPAYVGSPNELIKDNRLLKEITTQVPDVKVIHHHVSGSPVDQIAGFVQRNQPQLLVMGTHARRGISRIFGSIASKVMRTVDCPVVVLRQKQNSQEYSDLQSA